MTIQTIQQTSKKWKAAQLIGAIGACLGIILIGSATEVGGFLIMGGLIMFIVGGIGAWWNHG